VAADAFLAKLGGELAGLKGFEVTAMWGITLWQSVRRADEEQMTQRQPREDGYSSRTVPWERRSSHIERPFQTPVFDSYA
jgi:hypothetical protein